MLVEISLMMEAINTFETVNFYELHGAKSQKIVVISS
jgi:hypothetical protein